MNWKRVTETEPPQMIDVLLIDCQDDRPPVVGAWNELDFEWQDYNRREVIVEPTHYAELPARPKV